MDEVEGVRLQRAGEQVVDEEFDVAESLGGGELPGHGQHPLVDVGADHRSAAGPFAQDPQPTQDSASNVKDVLASSGAELGQQASSGGFEHQGL